MKEQTSIRWTAAPSVRQGKVWQLETEHGIATVSDQSSPMFLKRLPYMLVVDRKDGERLYAARYRTVPTAKRAAEGLLGSRSD